MNEVKIKQPSQLKIDVNGVVTIDGIQITIDPKIALFVACCVSAGSSHIEAYLDEILRLERAK